MIRHRRWLLPAALALFALCLSSVLLLSLPQTEAAEEPSAEIPAENRYILREVDGCVAVFAAADAEEPEQITAIEVASLPTLDRSRLAQGIGVSSDSELVRLLEDLGS